MKDKVEKTLNEEKEAAQGSQPFEPAAMNAPSSEHHITFAEALRFWVKLGFISFGGPAGQISIMHRELVERRRWLSEERFLHALNYCMLLPGPEAQQLATYIGWLMHKVRGGLVAGGFFVLPSVFVLLGLSYTYAAYGSVPAVAGMLDGFKPVVVAIVVEAVLKIGGRALKRGVHYIIAAGAFIAIFFLRVPFPLIVLTAAAIGFVGTRLRPAWFAKPKRKGDTARTLTQTPNTRSADDRKSTIIDDHTAPPAHTLPSRVRAFKTIAIGLLLWFLPFVLLLGWQGWNNLYAQQYRFFTQAALVTFGGAYAVLAYVTQAAAESFGWLSKAQAIDGLALAETTPGPLIMVVQFVGFMAGWNNPMFTSQALSGVAGALVTTYVTFLPCFLFIFLGAPYIEVLRGNRNLTGALTGITASVVGVVLNLALVFGTAVIWPAGLAGETNWFAAFLTIAAFIVLYRFKVDVLWIVVAGGLMGLARALLLV
jgi:chromate transporter